MIGLVLKLDKEAEYDNNALGIILLLMNITIVVLGILLSCLSFPKISNMCKRKREKKRTIKKRPRDVEMVQYKNPMHGINSESKKKKTNEGMTVQEKGTNHHAVLLLWKIA